VLDVAGSAAAVEKALHITLRTYQHPTEARQFFAPDTEPAVAADLPVADIQGLSDFSKPHPKFTRRVVAKELNGQAAKAPVAVAGQNGGGDMGRESNGQAARATTEPKLNDVDSSRAVSKIGSAPDGSETYFGDDFRNAYAAGTTLTGAGQMVGVLEFDGFYATDIADYASAAGGGRSSIVIQTVLLDGFNGVPTTGSDTGEPEVALDIEQAMAMAPGLAKIVVFEGGPNGLQNDILNSMAANSAVKSFELLLGLERRSQHDDRQYFQADGLAGTVLFQRFGRQRRVHRGCEFREQC